MRPTLIQSLKAVPHAGAAVATGSAAFLVAVATVPVVLVCEGTSGVAHWIGDKAARASDAVISGSFCLCHRLAEISHRHSTKAKELRTPLQGVVVDVDPVVEAGGVQFA